MTAHAQIPLEAHGQLDSDPQRNLSAAELAARLPEILEADTGLAEEPQTMRSLIETTTESQFEALAREGVARLGAFEFRQTDAGWKLVRVYLEE